MLPLKQNEIDPIQKAILVELNLSKTPLRFSQLQPEDLENDLFNYHLQFLVKKDYVKKLDEGYQISQSGKEFFSNLDLHGNNYKLFKYSIAAYLVSEGRLLMQKRARHPFINDTMTVSGKVLWGEKIVGAAKRKMSEECGLIADFKHIGVLRKTRRDGFNKVIEDTVYNVCFANSFTGVLQVKNEWGEFFWVPFAEVEKTISNNVDFGQYDLEVYKRVIAGNMDFFMFEQDMIVKDY